LFSEHVQLFDDFRDLSELAEDAQLGVDNRSQPLVNKLTVLRALCHQRCAYQLPLVGNQLSTTGGQIVRVYV
jgi:hypothetical protein